MAKVGCVIASCHVDSEKGLITGPSRQEQAEQMVNGAMGLSGPIGMVAGPLKQAGQPLLREGLEEAGEQATRLAGEELPHVFWSGPGAQQAAEAWAKANGGTTLEMSALGQQAEQATAGLAWEQARPVWEQASRQFAEAANGVVHVFHGTRVRLESIWAQIEYELLRANPNVKIIYHTVLEDGSIVDIP